MTVFNVVEGQPVEEELEDKLRPKKKQQAEKKPAKEVKAAFQHQVQGLVTSSVPVPYRLPGG
jgi:hypothetical protein